MVCEGDENSRSVISELLTSWSDAHLQRSQPGFVLSAAACRDDISDPQTSSILNSVLVLCHCSAVEGQPSPENSAEESHPRSILCILSASLGFSSSSTGAGSQSEPLSSESCLLASFLR